MKMERIECFLSVAETKCFSKSAIELNMSQPSVSRIISLLEDDLGFKLFKRTSKSVELSEAGEKFYAFAKNCMEEYNQVIEECRSLNDTLVLKVGTLGFAEDQLLAAVSKLVRDHKNVKVEMIPANFANQSQLANREVDCMMYWPYIIDDGYGYLKLFEGHDQVFVSKSNPIANKNGVSFEDLRNETFLVFGWMLQRMKIFDELHLKYLKVDDVLSSRRLLELNQGIVVSPDGGVLLESKNIVGVPLIYEEERTTEMGLTYRKDNDNPALKLLRTYLENK